MISDGRVWDLWAITDGDINNFARAVEAEARREALEGARNGLDNIITITRTRAERAEAERDALRERIVGMEEGRRLAGGSSHD